MNCCRETTKMGVPPGNRPAASRDWFRGVPERYVAGADTRGRQEGRPYPWSQQVIHEISGLYRRNQHAFTKNFIDNIACLYAVAYRLCPDKTRHTSRSGLH
ncbi:MAG: hypothetical protein V3W52_00755 [Syntrophobacteria bacterium]